MEISAEILKELSAQMLPLPAGEIELRDDRLKRKWKVQIPAFLMAKVPLSQRFYEAVTQTNPSTFSGADLPTESVSWLEAVRFCNLLSQHAGLTPCYHFSSEDSIIPDLAEANGYRLPNEAEWEYACRAGTSGPRYGDLDEIAWYKANSGGRTQAVGQKKANAWGLHDMLGNVWEWCSDIYDEEVYGAYRIFRGGAWYDETRSCLATNRRRSHPGFQIDDLGFRLARSL